MRHCCPGGCAQIETMSSSPKRKVFELVHDRRRKFAAKGIPGSKFHFISLKLVSDESLAVKRVPRSQIFRGNNFPRHVLWIVYKENRIVEYGRDRAIVAHDFAYRRAFRAPCPCCPGRNLVFRRERLRVSTQS